MENVTQDQWRELMANDSSDYVLVDVRTPMECEEGIQPGAIQINISEPENFISEIEKLDATKTYYVYCRSGGRSQQACMVMNSKGINKTYNLIGGMLEWEGNVVEP